MMQRVAASRSGRAVLGTTTALALVSCGAEKTEAAVPAQAQQPLPAGAVYYQPRLVDLHDPESQNVTPGAYKMFAEPDHPDTWTSAERCNPVNADNFIPTHKEVTTLGGFSLGRLGLAYFLQDAEGRQSNINYMIAIAPGNSEDFTDSCDPPNTAELVKNWMAQAPNNYFTVIADQRTAEQDFAGIRGLYLNGLKGTEQADQMTICASTLGHEATFNAYKNVLDDQQTSVDPRVCPAGTTAYAW